ncbi:unnamed protein product, partial [Brassica rapa subsp. trilocularis]
LAGFTAVLNQSCAHPYHWSIVQRLCGEVYKEDSWSVMIQESINYMQTLLRVSRTVKLSRYISAN